MGCDIALQSPKPAVETDNALVSASLWGTIRDGESRASMVRSSTANIYFHFFNRLSAGWPVSDQPLLTMIGPPNKGTFLGMAEFG